jgi:hypothetical protein
MWGLLRKVLAPGMYFVLDSWSSVPVLYSPNQPKSQIFNIGHDYALWIRNFMVMINTHFALLHLPGNSLKTKKNAPYFRGNTKFPIYFIITVKFLIYRGIIMPYIENLGLWPDWEVATGADDHEFRTKNIPGAKTFRRSLHIFNSDSRNSSYAPKSVFS